ncbi:hypothetical protein ILUMI_04852 [Ignelater luminosus]|uniref:DDHD domain-containing protein n=1 Tax=Ignelater luminosus TaxID=2038154 RepID=A0A8K0GE53_IGNLU|nr:hypothetical protein ILUMI_04852 [Ignelater luminosus]
MTTMLKAASYSILIGTYLYFSRRQFREAWKQYKKFSLSRYLGLLSYTYHPVNYHWFYKKETAGHITWKPFSVVDSLALEEAFTENDLTPDTLVPTDGGRYDVNILCRKRIPVYWNEPPSEVRRSSWFYKSLADGKLVPYQEYIAALLEDEFIATFETNDWHRKVNLPNGDVVVFQRPDIVSLIHSEEGSQDSWDTPQTLPKPRTVKRGTDDFEIEAGESPIIDHLLFVVHGIGSVCDLKFRSVEEVVDDFRSLSLKLLQTHYTSACQNKLVNRIEVLPINWHSKLHSTDTGIDEKLKNITLPSAPLLRDFINNTLSDVLLYKSPKYSQTIITAVGTELNRLYELFRKRNPTFRGSVSLGGHSLGSLILFDLLSNQKPPPEPENTFCDCNDELFEDTYGKRQSPINDRISSMMLQAGIQESPLQYPQLNFQPIALFALGSPISLFVTTKGLDKLGEDFALPTCPAFFNIFHPYDIVACRVESLINPELAKLKPVLIPHHKGGKRMHLQFKETMQKVKADLKEKWRKSLQTTLRTISQMRFGHHQVYNEDEEENDNDADEDFKSVGDGGDEPLTEEDGVVGMESIREMDVNFGVLNKGRRVDYALQEAPIESFNEYIFAMTLSSHLCYWESEDTMLLLLKEIYNSMGIVPDKILWEQEEKISRWQAEGKMSQNYIFARPSTSGTSELSFANSSSYLYMEPSMFMDILSRA